MKLNVLAWLFVIAAFIVLGILYALEKSENADLKERLEGGQQYIESLEREREQTCPPCQKVTNLEITCDPSTIINVKVNPPNGSSEFPRFRIGDASK